MALDKQLILNELGSVVNKIQNADCGCLGKIFSQPGSPNGYHGNHHWPHGCVPHPETQGGVQAFKDTACYLNRNLVKPIMKEVYDDLKSVDKTALMKHPYAAKVIEGMNNMDGNMQGGMQGGAMPGNMNVMPNGLSSDMVAMLSGVPNGMSKGMPGGDMQNEMAGGMPGGMNGGMPGAMNGGMPAGMNGGMPGGMPGGMSGMPNNRNNGMPNGMAANMPGGGSGFPSDMAGGMSNGMPNNMPGGMPNGMVSGMSGPMPEAMQKMFANMTNGMPGNGMSGGGAFNGGMPGQMMMGMGDQQQMGSGMAEQIMQMMESKTDKSKPKQNMQAGNAPAMPPAQSGQYGGQMPVEDTGNLIVPYTGGNPQPEHNMMPPQNMNNMPPQNMSMHPQGGNANNQMMQQQNVQQQNMQQQNMQQQIMPQHVMMMQMDPRGTVSHLPGPGENGTEMQPNHQSAMPQYNHNMAGMPNSMYEAMAQRGNHTSPTRDMAKMGNNMQEMQAQYQYTPQQQQQQIYQQMQQPQQMMMQQPPQMQAVPQQHNMNQQGMVYQQQNSGQMPTDQHMHAGDGMMQQMIPQKDNAPMPDESRQYYPVQGFPNIMQNMPMQNAQQGQYYDQQANFKENLLPVDMGRNAQYMEEYNTLGQLVKKFPLNPHSDVKNTMSKTSIQGRMGRRSSRMQLQNIYQQYKGSEAALNRARAYQNQIRCLSDNNLNKNSTPMTVPDLMQNGQYMANQGPVERIGDSNYTMQQVMGYPQQIAEEDGFQGDASSPRYKKLRNGLQDMSFTTYTPAAWSFNGNRMTDVARRTMVH